MPHDERCLHLALCSFCIFGLLKKALKSRMFALVNSVQEADAVVQWFRRWFREFFAEGYTDSYSGGGFACVNACAVFF